MGKKQGQDGATRTKGNVKPSSSAKAAEMIQNLSSNLANYSFNSNITPLGVGTLMEESFDSNLDSDFRAALRKLYKKDMLTKLKALDEMNSLIETKTQEECVTIISYWAKCYTKLTLDSERKIRETCQQTHGNLCAKITKSVAPSLKVIMPYWILAQSDTFIPSSRIAINSFKATFNETKQPEVVFFARDEILNVFHDYLITQSVKTLSDMKTSSEDEAQQKYETVVSICMRGFDLFLKFFINSITEKKTADNSASLEKLEKILTDTKFWKFSKDSSIKIRGEFFQLLNSLLDRLIINESLNKTEETEPVLARIRENLRIKLIPLVFYSCDEDNNACAYFIWQAILKCMKHLCKANDTSSQTAFWSLMNTKKTFIPKLIALLRHHANGNANSQNIDLVFIALLPLISKLNSVFLNNDERLAFFKDLFTKVSDGIAREHSLKLRANTGANRNKMINSMFDCLGVVVNFLIESNQTDDAEKIEQFFQEIVLKNITTIFEAYLDCSSATLDNSSFKTKLVIFLEKTIEADDSNPQKLRQSLKQSFWSQVNTSLISRLETNTELDLIQQATQDLIIVKKLSSLFGPFWTKFNETNKSNSLLSLVQITFSKFLNKFNSVIRSDGFCEPENNDDPAESLAFVHLKCLNNLCTSFAHGSLFKSFLSVNSKDNIDSCINSLLNIVNKRHEHLAKKETEAPENMLKFGLIDLYILLKPQTETNTIEKLNSYLLNDENCQKFDDLLEFYLILGESTQRTNLLNWFMNSDKFTTFFTSKYLVEFVTATSQRQVKEIELIQKLISLLVSSDSKYTVKVNDFYTQLVNTVIPLIRNFLDFELIKEDHLNKVLQFSKELLFNQKKLKNDPKTLWTILFDLFKLKVKVSPLKALDTLIVNVTDNLFDTIFEDESSKYKENDFEAIIIYAMKNINETNELNDYFENSEILFNIISQFIKTLVAKQQTDGLDTFFTKILFRTEHDSNLRLLGLKEIFNSLLFVNKSQFNPKLLQRFYLDAKTSYIYTQYQHQITQSSDLTPMSSIQWLKQIHHIIKIINLYFTNGSNFIFQSTEDSFLTSDVTFWYYLILSGFVLNKIEISTLLQAGGDINYEQTVQLVHSVKQQLGHLLFETKFLPLILANLVNDRFSEFVNSLFGSQDSFMLQLSNMSLFLIEIVDFSIETNQNSSLVQLLNQFSLKMIEHVVEIAGKQMEYAVKYYLCDIPFAKFSVIETVSKMNDNLEFYFTLFDSLIDKCYNDLISDLRLFKLNSSEIELENLRSLNFKMSILIKYSDIFIEFLAKKMFSSNPSTLQFIKDKFSKFILKIVDLFIDLKESNKIGGGYSFYYSFETEDNSELCWEKFILLNNLNKFYKLVFTDYTLMTGIPEQLSQYLSNKQWDFILCYTAAIAQRFIKPNIQTSFTQAGNNPVEILAIDFFSMVNLLLNTLRIKVKDNISGNYPNEVHSEWNAFFSKEIYDPILCLYVKVSNFYTSHHSTNEDKQSNYLFILSLGATKMRLMNCLSKIVSQAPFERLILNDLEPKLNVLDEQNKPENLAIHLTDKLKTVLNHLVPNLKHQMRSVQLSSYAILKNIMKNISSYYDIKNKQEEDDEEEESDAKLSMLNIFESLPHILRELLLELNTIFADLKASGVTFEQNILVTKLSNQILDTEEEIEVDRIDDHSIKLKEMCHDANHKFMSYLLVNSLILDMFSTNNLEFKVKLVNNLREISFNDNLMNCLFRLMPSFKNSSIRLFTSGPNEEDSDEISALIEPQQSKVNFFETSDLDESFLNRSVQKYACRMYKKALKHVPAMIRDWWNIQPKRIADQVDKYTIKYVSAVLLEEDIREINRSANLISLNSPGKNEPIMVEVTNTAPTGPAKKTVIIEDDETSTIKIRGMFSTREIVSTYKMKELNMELIIQLPINYPLGVVEVSSVRRLGVSEQEWRNWLIQLTTYLTHQNGSIIQSLQIWKKNVDKKFDGVEECCICYNVIHGTNYQLPKKKCRTCKKLFHSICLYKWFESSSKSTCPLCRNSF